MRYFGSKVSTIDTIHTLVSKQIPAGSFCDPFGGIGSVGSYLKSKGYDVWSGDILSFAYFFQIARLRDSKRPVFKKVLDGLGLRDHDDLIHYLNSITLRHGWFVSEYSEKRRFFTGKNARKIQACRREIRSWMQRGWINHDERAVLLASLVNSMDRVANTAATYYAFLKKWHRKALLEFEFQLLQPVSSGSNGHCFHEPANVLVSRRHFDVLYVDPPYNERSYAHYYHLPETIALETTPRVHGISGIPNMILDGSEFNSPRKAAKALADLLSSASFNLLVFHYADNGIITPQEVRDILSPYGKLEDFLIESKGYTTKAKERKIQHHLYMVKNA